MKMKPVSRIAALHAATIRTSSVLSGKDHWYYLVNLNLEAKFPTYHQARDHRAQSIAERAARHFLMTRDLPEKLTIPNNLKGNSAARFRLLLDALPDSIKAKF